MPLSSRSSLLRLGRYLASRVERHARDLCWWRHVPSFCLGRCVCGPQGAPSLLINASADSLRAVCLSTSLSDLLAARALPRESVIMKCTPRVESFQLSVWDGISTCGHGLCVEVRCQAARCRSCPGISSGAGPSLSSSVPSGAVSCSRGLPACSSMSRLTPYAIDCPTYLSENFHWPWRKNTPRET